MAKKHKILMIYISTFSFVIFILLFSVNSAFAGIGGVSLPGSTENAGVNFEIAGSEYLNITLNSSEEIKLKMESIPEMITMMIEPVSSATSSQITISGFLPNATYYKYQDDYHNLTEFVADNNGTYFYIQDISTPHFVFIQPRKSTKFIRDDATGGDCSLIGNWDNTTKTCALSADLNETIQIDSNNITLDGNNHALTGTGTGYGVYLYQRTGITLKNLRILNFSIGIYVQSSSNNNIISNFMLNNFFGVYLRWSSNSNVFSDNLMSNNTFGISIVSSNNNILTANIMSDNKYNFDIVGYSDLDFNNVIDTSNLVDGKPIYYVKDVSNQIYDSSTNAGVFYCIRCDNIVVKNLTFTKNSIGIFLWETQNSKLENVVVSDNWHGMFLYYSVHNNIANSAVFNNYNGIYLNSFSANNIFTDNTVLNNSNGFSVFHSDNNFFVGNITNSNSYSGFSIDYSTGNILIDNTSSNNYYGASFSFSNNNNIHNNNFINNSIQIYSFRSSNNVFNLPLPDGGNYWSNFDEPAEGCDDLNNDKICDSPYFFSGGQDNLPWIIQNGWEIEQPISVKAAELAKLVINAPYLGDGETWGGKGWDSLRALYVASADIFSGYNFWNNHTNKRKIEFGAGLDCSGLIMWAYNRSSDPYKYFVKNVIKYEGADGQYKNNSEAINESDLQAGDLLFLDKDNNGKADHVAMYVGEFVYNNETFDVVEAFSPIEGIVPALKSEYKIRPGFINLGSNATRRVVLSPSLGGYVKAGSPIDLIVTDPEGFIITPTTAIQTDEEYLREVPGELYYAEGDLGPDGRPQDMVYWPKQKIGDYIIKVSSESGVLPTETYNLDFQTGNQTITLAENAPISQIPSDGYGVSISETGTPVIFIPVSIDIKPDSYPNSINLGSNGVVPVAIFGSATFDVAQIDSTTIKLANAGIKLKGNGQPIVEYSDINGDGFNDITIKITTEALQLTENDIKANLEARLISGEIIKGADSVRIVP